MTLKELLHIATETLRELSPLEDPDFRLEEAVLNRRSGDWEVVVSFLVPNSNQQLSQENLPFKYTRRYKRVKIDAKTRTVHGFYMFEAQE